MAKKSDKPIKIGTLDSNKLLSTLNVYGFVFALKKFNEQQKIDGSRSSLFQSFADTNILEKSNNSTAYATFGKKSGLCNGRVEISPLGNLLINDKIDIYEYELILLSKQWIWMKETKKHLLQAFYEVFKDCPIENISNNDTKEKSLKEIFSDKFSAVVGVSLANYLEVEIQDVTNRLEFLKSALLISRLCIIENDNFIINPDAKDVWEMIKDFPFDCPDFESTSEKNYCYLGDTSHGIFEMNKDQIEPLKKMYNNIYNLIVGNNSILSLSNNNVNHIQKIYYGAPGTGKSNEIKELTGEGKGGIKFDKDSTFRITFHPDSDYASFVGAYKPVWDDDKEKIVYEFRPQPLLKAYTYAWKNPDKNVALIIEEINRGNCAQIFGDIFQLLDRHEDGLSKYPIEADDDMQKFLEKSFEGKFNSEKAINEDDKDMIDSRYITHYDNAFKKIREGRILSLPKNLSILATMNTSDQSLFPMDSAFKRRWDWEYMPIKNAELNWKIELDNDHEYIDWWDFLKRINKEISDLTTSEDKQLGYFFCQPDKFAEPDAAKREANAQYDLISAKRFVDKVIFYLWNDVFKEYAYDHKCCQGSDSNVVLFAQFYGKAEKTIKTDVLAKFFEQLITNNEISLVKLKAQNTATEVETIAEDEITSDDGMHEEPNLFS